VHNHAKLAYHGVGAWLVRTDGDPTNLETPVRNALRQLDPQILVTQLRPLTDYIDRAMAPTRFALALISVFAGLAAALAAIPERVPEQELAAADVPGYGRTVRRPSAIRWLGLALLVAAAGFGYHQWHTVQQVHEFEDIDMHLLASDLPIDAYQDTGFQNWLRTAFER
jgi:hypothetical protein